MSDLRGFGTRTALVGALAAAALGLAACGTRVTDEAIDRAEAGSPGVSGFGTGSQTTDGSGAGGQGLAGTGGTATGSTGTGTGMIGSGSTSGTAGQAGSGSTGTAGVGGSSSSGGASTTTGSGDGGRGGSGAPSGPKPSGAGGSSTGQAVKCAKSGPAIKLGQLGTFTGVIAASVGQSKQAMQVWAAYQNANGGVACHPIKLTQIDDQSDPTVANSGAKSLINDTKVAALVGTFSPIAMSGVRDGVKGSGVPVVGGDGADPIWTTTPGIFDVGAGINNQVYLLFKSEVDAGRKKSAIFYCIEANSCTSAGAVAVGDGRYSAKAAGQNVVFKASISITQPDFTAQCQSAKSAGADNVFLATESQSLTRFMQSCDSVGYYPQITTCGICMGFDTTNGTLQKFKVTSVTPVFPYMRRDTVAQRTFSDAFKAYAPGAVVNGISAQAWADGMMLQRALELLGPEAQSQEITPAMVLKGLGMVKQETLGGLIAPTSYTLNQPSTPNRCGTLLNFEKGTWGARSSKFTCGA